MARLKDKVFDRAETARPYVERALKDQELRQNVRNAFESAREVYNELIGGRGPVSVGPRAATDKDIQDPLKKAVDELGPAPDPVPGQKEARGRGTPACAPPGSPGRLLPTP